MGQVANLPGERQVGNLPHEITSPAEDSPGVAHSGENPAAGHFSLRPTTRQKKLSGGSISSLGVAGSSTWHVVPKPGLLEMAMAP